MNKDKSVQTIAPSPDPVEGCEAAIDTLQNCRKQITELNDSLEMERRNYQRQYDVQDRINKKLTGNLSKALNVNRQLKDQLIALKDHCNSIEALLEGS